MEEHYAMLLVSVFTFFLSVVCYTGNSIRFTTDITTITVNHVFFSISSVALIVIAGIVLRWNKVYAMAD
jgi:hypothetical protein